MSEEIKVGDKVRVSEDAPKLLFTRSICNYPEYVFEVRVIEDDLADIYYGAGKIPLAAFVVPTKYLTKVEDEEAKEPKFNVGDKVVVHYSTGDKMGRIQEVLNDGCYDVDYGGGCTGHHIIESRLYPYTEPTTPTIKVGDMIDTPKGKGKVTMVADGYVLAQGDNGEWWQMITIPIDKDKEFEDNIRNVLNGTDEFPMGGHIPTSIIQTGEMDWDAYTADLAKEIVLKVANKYSDPKEAADYAVLVAKAVVENLKKK